MNSNVDHEEVNKFAALAARWWDKDSEFKPLHDINPLRLNYIKEQCGGNLEGKRILDVGCGGGILSESLALEGATVVGIDLAEAGLEVAKALPQTDIVNLEDCGHFMLSERPNEVLSAVATFVRGL